VRTSSTAAKGQFTYWSQRLFHRGPNKGIRLDYFICSNDMFPAADGSAAATSEAKAGKRAVQVHDTYILHADTVGCSDHCPVMLVVKL
jgi:exonuclease III